MMAPRFRDDTPAPERPQPAIAAQAPALELPERPVDLWLIGSVLTLLGLGTVEVFAASATDALKDHADSYYFLKRQLVFLGLGGVAMFVAAQTDYRRLRRWIYWMLGGSLLLLVAVLFSNKVNGARRWFLLGPLSFQPVEFAKLALVSWLAYSLSKKADKVSTFTVGFAPHLVVCALMMGLLLMQPDLGSSIILGSTTLVLLFIAGSKLSYLLVAVLAAAPLAYHMIVGTPWRLQRFMAFFNPGAFSDGVAYQIVQSQIAIGSGGLTGLGLGEGRQALGYMPEGHNDYIMASVGEELGFLGFAAVLLLFGVIVWRGLRAALGARDVFGSYLAFGITLMFALQALVNTGVVLGAIPAKGLTLPFVSYGGSSLVMAMFLAGLLINIGRRVPARVPGRELVNATSARRKKARVILLGTRRARTARAAT